MLIFSLFSCKTVKPKQIVQNKKSVILGKNYQKLVETLTSFSKGSKGALKTDADVFLSSISSCNMPFGEPTTLYDSLASSTPVFRLHRN